MPVEDKHHRGLKLRGERAIANFRFNGWGGRYPHGLDSAIPGIVAERLGLPLLEAKTALGAGS